MNWVQWLMTDGYWYYYLAFIVNLGLVGANLVMNLIKDTQEEIQWRKEYVGHVEYAYW